MKLSGIPPTSVLGRILRLPLRLIPPGTVLPVMQGKLRGTKWVVGAGNHGYWLGSYEYDKRRAFERTVTRGSVVFDVGAHAGFYTLLASVLVGPEGRVFAFEPVPRNLQYLRRHLEFNRVANVTVVEAAVSDKSGLASFDAGSGSFVGHLSADGKQSVRTVALDELHAAGQLPLPDFIKMDIEGAELRALRGAVSVLEKSRATLFLATHGDPVHAACRRLLASLGYEVKAVDGACPEQSRELLALCDRGRAVVQGQG